MRILVTGAGSVMGQSIYRALAMHAFTGPAEVHFGNSDELGAGLYFAEPRLPIVNRPILPLARDPDYESVIANYIDQHGIDIVYAGTQHELSKIARLSDRIGKCATLPSHLTELCLDKNRCMDVLAAKGVRVPKSQPLDDFLARPAFDGPGIMKPNTSSASRNLLFFEDRSKIPAAEIEGRRGTDTAVQERLYGDEFTCGCYIDKISQRKHILCMRRTLTPDGATGFGEVVQDDAIEAYVASVADAFRDEGYDFGHINVQLMSDPRGPCLFEVNGRLSSTEAPKAHFGFNTTAAFLVNLVENREYDGFRPARRGRFLRYYEEVYWQ